jgi:hypothetical protein
MEKIQSYIENVKAAWKRAVDFVTSKTGKAVLFVAFTFLVAGWSYHKGNVHTATEVASLKQQLRDAKEEAATNKLAADTEHLKAEDAGKQLKAAGAINADLKLKVDKYVSSLAKRKGGACPLTDADTRGLLSIR